MLMTLKKKRKILFITKNWENGIERNTYYLTKELKKYVDIRIWEEDGNISETLQKMDFQPDFILVNDLRPTRSPKVTGLKECNIPFGIIMHDLTYQMDQRRAFIRENNVKYIFTHYRDTFLEWYPEFKDKMIWFPHYVNIDVFKDFNQQKTIDYLMMGAVHPTIYPLRQKILDEMKHLPNFIYHAHPGYFHKQYDEKSFKVASSFAQEINKAKMFFTCDSIYHYPVMKYYETLACNTLLLASCTKEIKDLGFIPGVHFIEINEDNFMRKANYHLRNYDTLGKKIALNGYKMVRQKHSVQVRAKQLLDHIEVILSKEGGNEQ
ncbi:hypothetical protein A499_19878 [Niallia nealsonii AAU1]|nr:hypothetical protein A499_19878 [Niallia nealsonii AAU1]